MDLREKLVVVSGASSGIGAATARQVAAAGARLALIARSEDKLRALAEELGGTVTVCPADLTDERATRSAAEKVLREAGVPDVLVNNAGAGRWLSVAEAGPQEAAAMMAVPYFAAYNLTHAFLPGMLRRNSGVFVNVTSAAAFVPIPGAAAYASARWAMRGFSTALRADLHRTRVRVMQTVFAKVSTDYFKHNPGSEDRIPTLQSMIPVLSPDQAAEAMIEGLRDEKETVVAPFMLRVVLALNALFPRSTRRLMYASGWQGSLLPIE